MELGFNPLLTFLEGGGMGGEPFSLLTACVSASVCPLACQRDGRQRVFLFFSKYSFYNNFTNITLNVAIFSAFEIY